MMWNVFPKMDRQEVPPYLRVKGWHAMSYSMTASVQSFQDLGLQEACEVDKQTRANHSLTQTFATASMFVAAKKTS